MGDPPIAGDWGERGSRNRFFQDEQIICAIDIDPEGFVVQFKPNQIWQYHAYVKNQWNSTDITKDELDGWLVKVLL
jgi:hypothetical protein